VGAVRGGSFLTPLKGCWWVLFYPRYTSRIGKVLDETLW
jgi:hypothetical protein